jgi:hypothetical protein
MNEISIVFLNWKRRENLSSILLQTLSQTIQPDMYLIDNASNDERYKITVTDPIKYIPKDNSLQCWARWELVKDINSNYFCVIDDDITFSDHKVLEICKNFMDKNPSVDAVGYAGVINDQKSQYWYCTHIQNPEDKNISVDVIKGRFMFIRRSSLEGLDMTPDFTCDDIKVSSHLKKKIVLSELGNKFSNMKEGDEALHVQVSQREKREISMRKYFPS